MIDQSEYEIGVPAEDLDMYSSGGYHPIHLHDRLKDGRYEVLNKLGFGSFSTVWLARDHHEHRNVSLKVVVANRSDIQNKELEILRHIKEYGDVKHPGRKHVSQLLDSFKHTGPNGQHLCIVLELLGPKVSAVAEKSTNYRLDGNLARRISRQLLLAIDYLHSSGLAHGDLHMGNVLFCIPDSGQSSFQAVQEATTEQIGEISRLDGAPLPSGLPKYLVEPFEYECRDKKHFEEVQLVDFGESFFISSPPKQIRTPLPMHPPELVFRRPLTVAVDIWNLGSTSYELVTGRTPFEACFDDLALIPQFQTVVGGVPAEWISDATRGNGLKYTPNDMSAEGFLSLEEEIQRSYFGGHDASTLPLTNEDLDMLGRYLRKMLVVDPKQRATSQALLLEPWISNREESCTNEG